MNVRKRFIQVLALSALAFGFAVSFAGWRGALARAAQPPQEPAAATASETQSLATLFGMQTLSGGRSVRLTAVNPRFIIGPEHRTGEAAAQIVPQSVGVQMHVALVFDVYEQNPGEPERLRFLRRESHEFMMQPGEAVSEEFASRTGETVSPQVFVIPPDNFPGGVVPPDGRPDRVVSTLEVLQGGRAQFTAPGARVGFDPQPDPPAPTRP
jgi:hypothetical protein